MQEIIAQLNQELLEYMKPQEPKRLFKAMDYSLNSGGKLMRPMFLLNICDMLGGCMARAMPFAVALEMIHSYSLVHDDLPAIDNDHMRRGKPTSHVAFGEAMAILAGDGLLNTAYEIMAKTLAEQSDVNAAKAMYAIAYRAGIRGMIAGQVEDILRTAKSSQDILEMYRKKSAGLFIAAAEAAAYLSKPDEAPQMARLGELVGLAFQIKDDLLDIYGDESLIGKPVGSDIRNNKVTYVSVCGIADAERYYQHLGKEALSLVAPYDNNEKLQLFLKAIIERQK